MNNMDISHQKQLKDFLQTLTFELNGLSAKDHRDYVFQIFDKEDDVGGFRDHDREVHTRLPLECSKQRIFKLLRAKLLQHKWGDVATILHGIAMLSWKKYNNNPNSEIMWRIGSDVLHHHPLGFNNHELLDTHRRTMGLYFETIDQTHVLLEYVFSLILKQDFEKAEEELKYYQSIDKGIRYKDRRRKNIAFWAKIIEGYLGLIEYALWKIMVTKEDTNFSTQQDMFDITTDNNEKNNETLAELATSHFRKILSEPGTWDIFVLKHAEILLYYNDVEQLKDDLCSYSVTNKDNPNAHKYLYRYLKNYESDRDVSQLITLLKRLHVISPADPEMLDLHRYLFDKWSNDFQSSEFRKEPGSYVDLLESFEVLLCMLDHACWIDDIRPWRALDSSLKAIQDKLENEVFLDLISKIWTLSERCRWWLPFHFNLTQARKTLLLNDSEMIMAKLNVASLFTSPDSDFCKVLRES
ncbi:TATA box-binding protein-associated factor RNA polymerase I subunit A-like [Clavelina lepadiformis]|uniref:TATA box-binding protein-associated factor RNA polymerase I subunit A-like n=1 Tax=Clavelina lepadiformis TaxID=159417 RepID=UPI004041F64E